jgi:hypothetical protein
MRISDYPDIVSPELPLNTIIWRYMDLPKLLDMLETKTLFFCRGDRFEDKFEGSLPENERIRQEYFNELYKRKNVLSADEMEYTKEFREKIFVNCWHKDAHENMAMWKIYGGASTSVAIITDVRRLADALPEKSLDPDYLLISEVHYLNFTDNIEEPKPIPVSSKSILWSHINQFFHKWKAFTYENEVRAVINTEKHRPLGLQPCDYSSDRGMRIPVDLNKLIDKIVLSPGTYNGTFKFIEDIVHSKIGNDKVVIPSSLAGEPIFLQ